MVNIARGREVSISRLAELVAELTGAPELCAVRAEARPGDVKRHLADVGKAKRLFGFSPEVEIEAGLARTWEWFRQQGIADRVDARASGEVNW